MDYMRMTKFIDVFNDKSNLAKRDTRYAVMGAVRYADKLADLDIESDRYEIDNLADRAAREAGKWHSADYGTAMHALTEDYDNGFLKPGFKGIPETPAVLELERGPMNMLVGHHKDMAKDLLGYAALVEAYQIETVYAEATTVLDEYKVAGTADRFVKIHNPMDLPYDHDAECVVDDLKTGSVDYGRREKVMQLAGYATSVMYNDETQERSAHNASRKYGYILHLPAGAGTGSIIPVKLERGIEFLRKAHENWEIRRTKEMFKKHGLDTWLYSEIEKVRTLDEMKDLFQRTQSYWTPDHVKAGKAKSLS